MLLGGGALRLIDEGDGPCGSSYEPLGIPDMCDDAVALLPLSIEAKGGGPEADGMRKIESLQTHTGMVEQEQEHVPEDCRLASLT